MGFLTNCIYTAVVAIRLLFLSTADLQQHAAWFHVVSLELPAHFGYTSQPLKQTQHRKLFTATLPGVLC